MGNCQAAEAATIVIQHPGVGVGVRGKVRKIERYYKSMSAKEVMSSNPGHYIALIVTSTSAKSVNGTPLKQLKLLRPDDILHLGQVYRLVSFEEVLKEFAAKKCVKLGRLLMKEKVAENNNNNNNGEKRKKIYQEENSNSIEVGKQEVRGGSGRSSRSSNNNGSSSSSRGGIKLQHQWRPALESISEVGT